MPTVSQDKPLFSFPVGTVPLSCKCVPDRGIVARLGWDLADLTRAVYDTDETSGASLVVAELMAGSARHE